MKALVNGASCLQQAGRRRGQAPAKGPSSAPALRRGRVWLGQQQRLGRLAPVTRAGGDGEGGPSPQAPKPADAQPKQQQRRPPGGPEGGGPEGGGPEAGGPPPLPPQQRRLLALLVEYGGVYGTAACLLGFFLKIDPFGGFHWDADDVMLGVQLYAPILLMDALVMLPDYAPKEDQADAVNRIFFGPNAALAGAAVATTTSTSGAAAAAGAPSAPPRAPLAPPPPPPPPLLRAQLALELLQSFQTRANPGIGLPAWQEGVVAAVASLADEMLYRAVALTFLAGWLKDRFYEAGLDDDVALPWTAGDVMPLPLFAQYSAMALVAGLGIAGFAAKALQDKKMVERVQILTSDGKVSDERAEAIKAQLVASMASQNAVIYAVEGVREISLGVASGLAFIWTGNLAAPFAGALLMQLLYSGYQRFCLERQKRRRRAAIARMQARSAQVKDAIAAAVAAKKAREAQAGPVSGEGGGEAGDGASSSGGGSEGEAGGGGREAAEEGMDERLTPAARVMLSDLEFKRAPGSAAAGERERDLAEIRAALADPPSGGGSGGGAAAPSVSASAAAAPAEAGEADARLAALLSDMMRSPEGRAVVKRFREGASQAGSSNGSGGGGGAEADVGAYIDSLLSDPEVRGRLLRELEARLVAMAEAEEGGKGSGGGGGPGR